MYSPGWKRVVAHIIDLMIIVLAIFGLTLVGKMSENVKVYQGLIALGTIVAVAYYILLTGKYGATLGKDVMKIKVAKYGSNENCGFQKAIIRYLIYLIPISLIIYQECFLFVHTLFTTTIDGRTMGTLNGIYYVEIQMLMMQAGKYIFLLWVIDYMTIYFNDNKRSIHDMIAGTSVIRVYNE